jgi:DNA-binding protein HU-beta
VQGGVQKKIATKGEGGSMNKTDLVEHVSNDTELTKADCSRILESIIENVRKAVKRGEDVKLTGFGTFTRVKRKARVGRNPQTGAEIKIPAARVPKFKPGKEFKEMLN